MTWSTVTRFLPTFINISRDIYVENISDVVKSIQIASNFASSQKEEVITSLLAPTQLALSC
jgi:hypothetical protein